MKCLSLPALVALVLSACAQAGIGEGQDAGHDLSACQGTTCACSTDSDCPKTIPRCGPEGLCVPCNAQNDNCGAGLYCHEPEHQCVPGCKVDKDCVPQGQDGGVSDGGGDGGGDGGTSGPLLNLCDTAKHMCAECITDKDCPVGQLCTSAGRCA